MMSKRDEFQVIVKFAVNDKEREASKWKPANAPDANGFLGWRSLPRDGPR
jgi:hypothetical protein